MKKISIERIRQVGDLLEENLKETWGFVLRRLVRILRNFAVVKIKEKIKELKGEKF